MCRKYIIRFKKMFQVGTAKKAIIFLQKNRIHCIVVDRICVIGSKIYAQNTRKLPPFDWNHCGAIILLASQKRCVKALSEARRIPGLLQRDNYNRAAKRLCQGFKRKRALTQSYS
jgi:hypothetical protein